MAATVDINVLVHAASPSSPFRERAQAVMERLARGPELLHLFWPVLMGYLRVVTNPRVVDPPQPPADAMDNVANLLALPQSRVGGELDGFWGSFTSVVGPKGVRGNLVPDAHLVALMRQHGVVRIWTHDRGFRRFDGIEVLDPYEAP